MNKVYTGNSEEKRKDSLIGLGVALILFVISLILLVLSRILPGFAGAYTKTVYSFLQGTVGRASGLLPFSLSEFLIYALAIILLFDLIINIKKIGRFLRHLVLIASVLFFLYSANCGVNYYSPTFAEAEGLSPISSDDELLESFCTYIAQGLQENSAELGVDDATDLLTLYPDEGAMKDEAVASMKAMGSIYASLKGHYPKPKQITISRPFSNMEVTGIYSPFFIEANYNGEMAAMNVPFTMCHELSHLRGFMNEGEANYIGWLACTQSSDPYFNRSAYLVAWQYAGGQLYRVNRDRYNEIRSLLPQDAIRELKEDATFWNTYKTKASDIQDKVNDSYLKSNGQKEGIGSYNKVVGLMLAWFKESGSSTKYRIPAE